MDPLPADFKVGVTARPSPRTAGRSHWSRAVEYRLGRALALDLSAMCEPVQSRRLRPHAGRAIRPPVRGSTFEGRLGLTWFPQGETSADVVRAPRDVGQKPSYGWAAGEVLAINLGASYFNEYVRNANFNQISPRSWWDELSTPASTTTTTSSAPTSTSIRSTARSTTTPAARTGSITGPRRWPASVARSSGKRSARPTRCRTTT